MTDCEVRIKYGKYELMRCFEKSFLHNDDFPAEFKSNDAKEVSDYIKKILINAVNTENNLGGEEFNLFVEIIKYISWVKSQDLSLALGMDCEIASR